MEEEERRIQHFQFMREVGLTHLLANPMSGPAFADNCEYTGHAIEYNTREKNQMMAMVELVFIVNNYYDRLYHTSCRYHTSCFIYIYLHSHRQAGTAHNCA